MVGTVMFKSTVMQARAHTQPREKKSNGSEALNVITDLDEGVASPTLENRGTEVEC